MNKFFLILSFFYVVNVCSTEPGDEGTRQHPDIFCFCESIRLVIGFPRTNILVGSGELNTARLKSFVLDTPEPVAILPALSPERRRRECSLAYFNPLFFDIALNIASLLRRGRFSDHHQSISYSGVFDINHVHEGLQLTLMQMATLYGDSRIIKNLLAYEHVDIMKITPEAPIYATFFAVKCNTDSHVECLELLLDDPRTDVLKKTSRASVSNISSASNMDLLSFAIMKNNVPAVRAIIKSGRVPPEYRPEITFAATTEKGHSQLTVKSFLSVIVLSKNPQLFAIIDAYFKESPIESLRQAGGPENIFQVILSNAIRESRDRKEGGRFYSDALKFYISTPYLDGVCRDVLRFCFRESSEICRLLKQRDNTLSEAAIVFVTTRLKSKHFYDQILAERSSYPSFSMALGSFFSGSSDYKKFIETREACSKPLTKVLLNNFSIFCESFPANVSYDLSFKGLKNSFLMQDSVQSMFSSMRLDKPSEIIAFMNKPENVDLIAAAEKEYLVFDRSKILRSVIAIKRSYDQYKAVEEWFKAEKYSRRDAHEQLESLLHNKLFYGCAINLYRVRFKVVYSRHTFLTAEERGGTLAFPAHSPMRESRIRRGVAAGAGESTYDCFGRIRDDGSSVCGGSVAETIADFRDFEGFDEPEEAVPVLNVLFTPPEGLRLSAGQIAVFGRIFAEDHHLSGCDIKSAIKALDPTGLRFEVHLTCNERGWRVNDRFAMEHNLEHRAANNHPQHRAAPGYDNTHPLALRGLVNILVQAGWTLERLEALRTT